MKKALFFAALFLFPLASYAMCTELSSDLIQGANDAKTKGAVTKLQNFLKTNDYLSATPNGNFGPATFAAVKKFQSANNLSATGIVNAATRTLIRTKSCASAVSTQPVSTQNAKLITSPRQGDTFTIGQNQTVAWNVDTKPNSVLVLDDENGVAKGVISSNIYGVKSHAWKAGKVYSAESQSEKNVPPGTYRIHIQDSTVGRTANDPISGAFTLVGASVSLTTITPGSVPADDTAAVVIFGNGLTSSSFVLLDGAKGLRMNKLFVSGDGKVLVFSVPRNTPLGIHTVTIKNGYETVDVGTLTVTLGE